MAGVSKAAYRKAVVNGLKNLRGRQLKDVPARNILITKAGWYKNGNEKVAGPFASGSELFKGLTGYPIRPEAPTITSTATLFTSMTNMSILWWRGGWRIAQEPLIAYALTELIQWVWKSRVRRGEEITLGQTWHCSLENRLGNYFLPFLMFPPR